MRRGVTLLELIVVTAVLGILYSLAAISVRHARPAMTEDVRDAASRARIEAIRSARAVRRVLPDGTVLTALPDGRGFPESVPAAGPGLP